MLTADQVEHFLDKGYVVIRGCFSRAAAAEFTAHIWQRLGYDEHDPSTWTEVGDVYLLHPFVLHARSQNMLRVPRFITNPPLTLAEPMRFDRSNPDELSP